MEKDDVYRKYVERVGDMVVGEVSQIIERKSYRGRRHRHELLLPKQETIKGDFFRKGDMVRCVIKNVEMKNNTPVVVVSRTENNFLEKLLEQEVPKSRTVSSP